MLIKLLMTKYAKKVDNNQSEIVKTFKQLGYAVLDLSAVGLGIPDLLISKAKVNYLVEIKSDKGKLTEPQEKFIKSWNADVFVIRSVDDVLNFNKSCTQNAKTCT